MTEPAAGDQLRIAKVLLAGIRNDQAARNKAHAEIEAAPGGWPHAFSAPAELYTNLMITTCRGDQGRVRQVSEMAALDASLHDEGGSGG